MSDVHTFFAIGCELRSGMPLLVLHIKYKIDQAFLKRLKAYADRNPSYLMLWKVLSKPLLVNVRTRHPAAPVADVAACLTAITLQSGVPVSVAIEAGATWWYRYVALNGGTVEVAFANIVGESGIVNGYLNGSCASLPDAIPEFDNISIESGLYSFAVRAGNVARFAIIETAGLTPLEFDLTLTFRAGVVVRNEAGKPFRNDAGRIFTQAA